MTQYPGVTQQILRNDGNTVLYLSVDQIVGHRQHLQ